MNTKAIFFSLLVIVLPFSIVSQPSINWVESYGSSYEEAGQSLVKDAGGNIYFTGYRGYGSGDYGFFIGKVDSGDSIAWDYSPKTKFLYYATPHVIRADTFGFLYLLFELEGTVIFDKDTITSYPGLHLVKLLDSTLIWHTKLPYVQYESNFFMETTKDGTSYIASSFSGTEVFGPDTITALGNADFYISKISNNGQFLWTRNFGNSALREDVAKGLSLDSLGNVFGYYSLTFFTSNGNGTSYIVKVDSLGNLIRQAKITGYDSKKLRISRFLTSPSGISYILMHVNDSLIQIKDTTLNFNYNNHLLVKYDSTLDFIQSISIADSVDYSHLIAETMKIDTAGNIYRRKYLE